MKKKLLSWHDYLVPTGFGNVAKNLLQDAHQEWEVHTVGINYRGDSWYDTTKGFVYSTTESDPVGMTRLVKIAEKLQPDLIFLFQDHFHISQVLPKLKEVAPNSKYAIYFPVDGGPFSPLWGNIFDVDLAITYTDWAIKVVHQTFPTVPLEKLYHGIDPEVFYPLSAKEIKEARSEYSWTGKFVAINVNKFQPRKQIAQTLRVWSMFVNGHKSCSCGHCMTLNHQICEKCHNEDLTLFPSVARDAVLYLHMNPVEPGMGPGWAHSIPALALNAGFTDKDLQGGNRTLYLNSVDIYGPEGPTEADINRYYNAANLNITTACGEGAGLSLLESAATGTPSLAPFNSAIPEMVGETGSLAKIAGFFSMPRDNGHIRPTVDEADMLRLLIKRYDAWKKAGNEKVPDTKCISHIQDNFLWEPKRNWLMEKFREITQ